MDGDALPLTAQLQAWRAQGADRADPARFDILQALAARISAHEGEARRLLEARLAGLMRAYAEALAQRPPAAPAAKHATVAASGLRELVAALQPRAGQFPDHDTPRMAPAMLTEARETWAQVRTDSQLRASLHDLPADAGPLNSGMLVHRALHLMRATSPGYLQHFIAYADTLSSLEQLQHAVALLTTTASDAPRAPRRAPRKRRPAGAT